MQEPEDIFPGKERWDWRREPCPEDRAVIRQLVDSTGFFSPAEAAIAVELVTDRLDKKEQSEYRFLFAVRGGEVGGYACYGPIPGTAWSFDLYWIVVSPSFQGRGLGRTILAETEALVREGGGRRIYADTSSRGQYAPTRAFYERCGYRPVALLEEFYGPGDGKVIYLKILEG